MAAACPGCGAPAADQARFCAQCGRALVDADGPPPAEGLRSAEAERRQLTVMFCDLVGSTALSGRLDPEDLREILREYHEASTQAIRDFDGFVAEYLGDGLVVYFGYPQAHEDDAERACRAGLRIIENMARLNEVVEPRLGSRLGVRVGIHTGQVVVGEVGARDVHDVVRVVGETPNVAARVQGEAPVDGVAVTSATLALAGPRLASRSLGPRSMKGVAEPVEVFQVIGVSDAANVRPIADVPIVDRREAQAALRAAWNDVRAGKGHAVSLTGPAGIGKSKLLDAFRGVVEADGGQWLEGACSAYHAASPWYPLVAILRGRPPLAVDQLSNEEAALIGWLLGSEPKNPQLGVAPPLARRATNDALLRALRVIAGEAPLALAIEDLHWADTSTAEFVAQLRTGPADGVLLVTTAREGAPGHGQVIELPPLGEDDASALVELTAGGGLSTALCRDLAERSDGVPLFVTELVRNLMESGAVTLGGDGLELRASLGRDVIPARLQDLLMARIDRLGPAKRIAQAAAAIGRSFDVDLLVATAGGTRGEILAAVEQLERSSVVEAEGSDPGRYVFTHALLRDVSYGSMLRASRRDHHRRIGDELLRRAQVGADLAIDPAVVAHHLAEAGDAVRSHFWWRQAADQATRRSASADALAALRRAVAELEKAEAGSVPPGDHLATYAALGSALAAVRGYGHQETCDAYRHAHQLAAELPAAAELFPVLFGIVAYSTARGDFAAAGEAAERLLRSADDGGDDGLRVEALFSLGILDVYTGRSTQAVDRLGEGIRLYDPERHHQLAYRYVFDPGVACLRSISIPLTALGDRAGARQSADDAIALADRLDHPFSLASALVFSSILGALHGDRRRTVDDAEAAFRLASKGGYPFWATSARILRGWAADAHLDDARDALVAYQGTGTKVFLPLWHRLLADAVTRTGRRDEARRLAVAGAAVEAETGERCWSALL